MAPRVKPDSASAELIVPRELIDFDPASTAQLRVESSTYGSTIVVYGSAAAWSPVSNAADLQAAIASGVAHIQIRSHLDLTLLQPPPGVTHVLGTTPSSVKSITGDCKLPASSLALAERGLLSDVPLLPLRTGQCLLIHNDNLISTSAGSLWIDNVYLRVGPNATFPTAINMNPPSQPQLNERSGARLWLTDTTIQSNGASHSIGVDVQSNSQAYLQGVTFANFDGTATPVHVGHPDGRASVSMVGCAFTSCNLSPTPDTSGLVTAWGSAAIRAQACSIADCSADWTVRQAGDGGAAVYADALPVPDIGGLGQVQRGAPRPLAEAGAQFLSSTDGWFLQTRQDVIAAFGLRSEDAGSLSSSRSSTGISLTVVLTIIGVAIVAGGVLTYVGYNISSMRERRKRRLRRNTVHTSTMSAAEPQESSANGPRTASRKVEPGHSGSGSGQESKLGSGPSLPIAKSHLPPLHGPASGRHADAVSASAVSVAGVAYASSAGAHSSDEAPPATSSAPGGRSQSEVHIAV